MEKETSKEEILEKFKVARERDDHLRWRLYAERLLRISNGRETALTGEDIISEVLDRILTGDRKFRDDINLDQYVMMTIKSIVNNETKKNEKNISENYSKESGENDDMNSIIDTTTKKTFTKPNEKLESTEFFNRIMNAMRKDDDAQLVLLEMKDGNLKTCEIAESLGITPEGVTNIKKRIKRRVDRKNL